MGMQWYVHVHTQTQIRTVNLKKKCKENEEAGEMFQQLRALVLTENMGGSNRPI